MDHARSQPIAISGTTRTKNAALIREQNERMLRDMYAMCGHFHDGVKKIKTLSEAGFVYEPHPLKRDTIGPATVRSMAPPDWSSETKYIWYSGQLCSIAFELSSLG